jgi:hypothetical protein
MTEVAAKPITRRALLDYQTIDQPKSKRHRLYFRNGILVNPKVEEYVKANLETLTAVRLRRSKEPIRILNYKSEE